MPEIYPDLKIIIVWVTFAITEIILSAYQVNVKARVFAITKHRDSADLSL